MREENVTLEKLMHTFHRMHHGCMRYQFEKRGLRDVGNPAVLFVLRSYDEPITQKEIADRLGISPPTVAVSVKRMERAGLLRKETSAHDLRKNCISLTEKGKAITDESINAEREIYRNIVEGFSPVEKENLRGFYMRMIDNMRGFGCRVPTFCNEARQSPHCNTDETFKGIEDTAYDE